MEVDSDGHLLDTLNKGRVVGRIRFATGVSKFLLNLIKPSIQSLEVCLHRWLPRIDGLGLRLWLTSETLVTLLAEVAIGVGSAKKLSVVRMQSPRQSILSVQGRSSPAQWDVCGRPQHTRIRVECGGLSGYSGLRGAPLAPRMFATSSIVA
ncbi:hypothetical protein B296_00005532 [Ensete ventricosum]|uniref:Uncharacterized protein n=1 Tax=Ensete ventricosum TaxID=4639 RepID=A0A427APT0_ENSVE|nr:hypothetical protein B296_00005532 [Ensete ventricosum]